MSGTEGPTLCHPTRFLSLWDFLGKNAGVGSHSTLQVIEPGSPALKADHLPSEAPGRPGRRQGHCENQRSSLSVLPRSLSLVQGWLLEPYQIIVIVI